MLWEVETIRDLSQLTTFWQDEQAALRAYVKSLDSTALQAIVEFGAAEAPQQAKRWHILLHLLNHSTQHRTELARYLSQGETAQVIEADNGALQVLALQGAATRSLLMEGALDAAGFAELQRQLRGLHELQGRSERIKDFPYPRQHAFINALFLRILCVLVPFGMLGEAERLNGLVSGWAQGQMVWLTIPLSLLVSWMYTSLDQVGESTENPFEGGANDVPISAICQDIERDLREVLGEGSVPRAMRQAGDITV